MATTWRPDTCGCELRFKDAEAFENGEIEVLKICDIHRQMVEGTIEEQKRAVASRVKSENQMKNCAFGTLLEEVKSKGKTMINFKWEFDAQRNLLVDYETLTLSKRNRAQIEVVIGRGLDGIEIDEDRKQKLVMGYNAIIEKPDSGEKQLLLDEISKVTKGLFVNFLR